MPTPASSYKPTRTALQPRDIETLINTVDRTSGPGSFEGEEGVEGDDSKHNVGRLCRIQAQPAKTGPRNIAVSLPASQAAVAAPCPPPDASRGGWPVRQVIGEPAAHLPPSGLAGRVLRYGRSR